MNDDVDSRARERVGTVLGEKWALESLLGIGGMAAVYAARYRNGARAAVKVLHADLSRHAEVRERFRREGYAANRVEHPGVVKVLDDEVVSGGPDSGTAYLVMELLEGESLQDRLERGPSVGEREFLQIAESVLDVLEAAHDKGVIHRDLKPENLFLPRGEGIAQDGPVRVKVLDFGLARLLQGQAITTYGLALGTPSFMSPEQAAGRLDEIDGRTDLFALAATGFRLRTGRRIHEGVNAVDLVRKMANFAAPRVRELVPEASEPFARVIDRALEFRREDRYENAAAMRGAVRRAIADLDAVDTATLRRAPSPAPPPPEPTIEVSQRDLEHTPARLGGQAAAGRPEESIRIPRRWMVWPWIALLLVGGAGGFKLWLDGHAAKAPAPAGDPTARPSDGDHPSSRDADVPPSSSHRQTPAGAASSSGHKLPAVPQHTRDAGARSAPQH